MSATPRKSEPIHVRLPARADELLTLEARRLGVGKGTLLARYADEALRMRRFPGIVFAGPEGRRRAMVSGTGLDVWEIASLIREFGSREALLGEYASLDQRTLDLARRYADEYPDEIEQRSSLEADHAARLFPFIAPYEDE